jgi:DNA-3-methyladenine glycosylase
VSPFDEAWCGRDPVVVAPELLNKVLVGPNGSGRIVEVEAYRGGADPASHAFRGPTPRSSIMFGPAGRLYVYFSYGMHWCANVVCAADGTAGAVLLRALAPLTGLDAMWAARPAARRPRDLCSGPAKLCAALGITGDHNGVDLFDPASPVRLVDDGTPPPDAPVVATRIGIAADRTEPWRWYVAGDPNVSAR